MHRLLCSALALAACVSTVTATPALRAQAVTAVPTLNQDHLTGTWYEIERLPNKREKHCVSDVVELIAIADKPHQLELVNACTSSKGYTATTNRKARAKDAGGAFKAGFFPFSSQEWVLALGPDSDATANTAAGYQWALIGTPNHKELWIYSKTQSLSPEVLADIHARAAAQGFGTAKLITPAHNPLLKH